MADDLPTVPPVAAAPSLRGAGGWLRHKALHRHAEASWHLRVHPLHPLCPPGRRLPRLPEVDALADDLAVAELHDTDGHDGPVVVADGVLVDPQVVAANRPVQQELLAGWVGGPEGGDVGLAADALAALGPFQHGVLGVDRGGAVDVVARSAAGRADGGGVEVVLDHRPGGGLIHGWNLLVRWNPWSRPVPQRVTVAPRVTNSAATAAGQERPAYRRPPKSFGRPSSPIMVALPADGHGPHQSPPRADGRTLISVSRFAGSVSDLRCTDLGGRRVLVGPAFGELG